jgi:hypothetical protein
MLPAGKDNVTLFHPLHWKQLKMRRISEWQFLYIVLLLYNILAPTQTSRNLFCCISAKGSLLPLETIDAQRESVCECVRHQFGNLKNRIKSGKSAGCFVFFLANYWFNCFFHWISRIEWCFSLCQFIFKSFYKMNACFICKQSLHQIPSPFSPAPPEDFLHGLLLFLSCSFFQGRINYSDFIPFTSEVCMLNLRYSLYFIFTIL